MSRLTEEQDAETSYGFGLDAFSSQSTRQDVATIDRNASMAVHATLSVNGIPMGGRRAFRAGLL
jgi:hypothetical protein